VSEETGCIVDERLCINVGRVCYSARHRSFSVSKEGAWLAAKSDLTEKVKVVHDES
jgi:hypothetical protein